MFHRIRVLVYALAIIGNIVLGIAWTPILVAMFWSERSEPVNSAAVGTFLLWLIPITALFSFVSLMWKLRPD